MSRPRDGEERDHRYTISSRPAAAGGGPIGPGTAQTINSYNARVLDPTDAKHHALLEQLRADPVVEIIDQHESQLEELRTLRPPPDEGLIAEACRWVYYPWRRAVVALLGPRAFRAVRLDRNRNVITTAEQDRLGSLRIGVAGLSVGHVIAHILAAQGMCGELRLADFDSISG